MGILHNKIYPGESAQYRAARDELLQAELELRRRISEVSAMRAALPPGGQVPEDYIYEAAGAAGDSTEVSLSGLFRDGKDSLIIYSLMYAPGAEQPCPACASILDGLNGSAPHIMDRVNLAVVGKAPAAILAQLAAARDWHNLNLYSSGNNTYNSDYFSETPDGAQLPLLNVFRRIDGGIHHSYSTELFHVPTDDGQDPRHADALWPVWNAFDLTPEGRGTDWYPKLSYD